MLVVDASIVAEYLIQGPYTANTEALFVQVAAARRPVLMPEFGFAECINVLWKRVHLQNASLERASRLIFDLRQLPIEYAPFNPLMEATLEIGVRNKLPVYDSVYIALAKYMTLPLITLDQRQAAAAQTEGVTVTPITQYT